jgi:hypothetical protein
MFTWIAKLSAFRCEQVWRGAIYLYITPAVKMQIEVVVRKFTFLLHTSTAVNTFDVSILKFCSNASLFCYFKTLHVSLKQMTASKCGVCEWWVAQRWPLDSFSPTKGELLTFCRCKLVGKWHHRGPTYSPTRAQPLGNCWLKDRATCQKILTTLFCMGPDWWWQIFYCTMSKPSLISKEPNADCTANFLHSKMGLGGAVSYSAGVSPPAHTHIIRTQAPKACGYVCVRVLRYNFLAMMWRYATVFVQLLIFYVLCSTEKLFWREFVRKSYRLRRIWQFSFINDKAWRSVIQIFCKSSSSGTRRVKIMSEENKSIHKCCLKCVSNLMIRKNWFSFVYIKGNFLLFFGHD